MESQESIAATSTTSVDEEDPGIEGLPRYLTLHDDTVGVIHREDVAEEQEEEGDGGDSDEEAEDIDFHDSVMRTVMAERAQAAGLIGGSEDENVIVEDIEENSVLLEWGTDVMSDVHIPGTPPDWVAPAPKVDKGEPASFSEVDNPGRWSEFTFRPTFSSRGEYVHHALPTGATPVKEAGGRRAVGDWEFFYSGWTRTTTDGSPAPARRSGATPHDLFPASRKGSLDAEVLAKLGLTRSRMQNCDALFFYQLLFPMCDPKRSGIDDDPRKPFYSSVEMFSNVYAMSLGLGGSYGHNFRTINLPELVNFDGVVVRDGVRGGSNGAIYRRWMKCADFDDFVSDSISYRRWIQLKRVYKLCNNSESPKRGQEGYNPAYKYDMLYDVLFSNVRAVSKRAELDMCGDETTWGHEGFGEAGSGLTGRIMGKPGVTKGGQIVVVSDVGRIRPRAYIHRHKLHHKPPGWTAMGPLEVKLIMEKILPMVEGEAGTAQKLYTEKPHSTWDNYFSGDKIMDWLGENGFGGTMTTRRDRLQSGIPGEFLHKKKTDSSQRSRAARFHQPIVVVKTVEATEATPQYERVHCSFQSTSSCNISTVNALNGCHLSVRHRQRGRNDCKRHWGIEMNDARSLYLQTYSRIDSIDHLIKNCRLFYRSWKYWHSPMLHGKALAVVVAYDMYLECAEGELEETWKIVDAVDFWTFREALSEQMLVYDPRMRLYPGDEKMRVCTQQNREQRRHSAGGGESAGEVVGMVTLPQFIDGKRGGEQSRLCGDLSRLRSHFEAVQPNNHGRICAFCGEVVYWSCGLCKKGLHLPCGSRGSNVEKTCFLDYHDDMCFGLSRDDIKQLFNQSKSEWQHPSARKRKRNKRHILHITSSEESTNS